MDLLLCSEGHLVRSTTRVGEALSGELVELTIHCFRLGKAGGGVIEISHRHEQPL